MVILLVGAVFFLCISPLFFDWKGPYHHAAIVSTPKKTVSVGEATYSLIDKKLYKHNNEQLENIELNYGSSGRMQAKDIASDGQKLYIVCYSQLFCLENDSLTLHSISEAYSLTINNGKIYYVTFKEKVESNNKYELCSYDIKTQINESICDIFGTQGLYQQVEPQIITVDNQLLFINEQMDLSWVDLLEEQNRAAIWLRSYMNDVNMFEEISFALGENIAYLKTIEQGIQFQYLDKAYEYPIQAENLRLYPIVKVIDNKLYFAVNDWSQKKDCERTDCICAYNSSTLITFDLESKQFYLQKQIGEREVFVDFGKDECVYYAKDTVYKNDAVIKVVGEVKPAVFYKTVVEKPYSAYELKLAYDGEKAYFVLIDNRHLLKEEYW